MLPVLALLLGQAVPSNATIQDDAIIVEARRREPADTVRQVEAISEAASGQLPQFHRPVCPAVLGLSETVAKDVIERIAVTVSLVRLPVAKENCRPNLWIIATDDTRLLLKRLRQKRPNIFGSAGKRLFRSLDTETKPDWSWKQTEIRRSDGGTVDTSIFAGTTAIVVNGANLSRLTSPIREEIAASYVVLDAHALSGLSATQIADFAAMTSLASVNSGRARSLSHPSILGLFEDRAASREPQSEMTAFDRAYLSALYANDNGYTAAQKIRAMSVSIDRALGPDRR